MRGSSVRAFPAPNELAADFSPPPVGLGRGAQSKVDQGERLSERSEFELDPGWTEHRRLSYWGQTPISLRCVAPHPKGEP